MDPASRGNPASYEDRTTLRVTSRGLRPGAKRGHEGHKAAKPPLEGVGKVLTSLPSAPSMPHRAGTLIPASVVRLTVENAIIAGGLVTRPLIVAGKIEAQAREHLPHDFLGHSTGHLVIASLRHSFLFQPC